MFPLVLIVLIALLLAVGLALLLPKRQLPQNVARVQLSEHASRGLFGEPISSSPPEAPVEWRKGLLARADSGDIRALSEAQGMRDIPLYGAVLDVLIELARSRQETFDVLVSHILENELRANSNLANRLIEQFVTTIGRRRAVEALHIAALADDAATFEKAVDTVMHFWSDGRIPELSAQELRELFESEYWVIAPEARRSGAGFALKQRLAEVRRQLAIANRRT